MAKSRHFWFTDNKLHSPRTEAVLSSIVSTSENETERASTGNSSNFIFLVYKYQMLIS